MTSTKVQEAFYQGVSGMKFKLTELSTKPWEGETNITKTCNI